MYRDTTIIVNKNNKLYTYFKDMCFNSTSLYNTTNYYIRQCMTGIKKSPEKRFSNETEVLHNIFNNISKLNDISNNNYNKKINNILSSDLSEEEKSIKINKISVPAGFNYPTEDKWFLGYNIIDGIFKVTENKDYNNLPSQVNQQTIKECTEKWKAYFNALKSYKKNPSLFTGKPKIPGYLKKDLFLCSFTNIVCKLKTNDNNKTYLRFPNTSSKLWLGNYIKPDAKLKEVRVKPICGVFEVHIIIEEQEEIKQLAATSNRVLSIDLGVDNFTTIVNNIGLSPILIKGNIIKSRNQWYNKEIAYYQSLLIKKENKYVSKNINRLYYKRYRWFKDYFHKISNYIINYALNNDIDTIVIGKNNSWKQNINIGNKNNQSFNYIPYEMFLSQMGYKTKRAGIKLIVKEESYTSKASFIDNDTIPTYGETVDYSFSGKRIARGLYKSKEGIILNADINGSANIMRKHIKEAADNIVINSLLNPVILRYKDIYKIA